ncbi:energy-coupling factor ABC transporter substrate-binding protein [Clostridium sp. CX1]|uniref:energy-coupling factor ABC transporter substrate-binding protein n=1 Tax=Clostridium sp. CX1 TaxID=2978346 RepID=UPI0021C02E84|nr:energy-coupling factor ABC transporter substrate-binding protein [Clostridium sp. CX1]MCT8976639.1 energy-coupling factor ABC transporter substrate-binding protein [Clostridium sp. CX1]
MLKRKSISIGIVFVALLVMLFIAGSIGSKALEGTDDQAQAAVAHLDENYKPWFNSVWEPSSDKVEEAIFALQAGIGITFIIYYLGRKKHAKTNNGTIKN